MAAIVRSDNQEIVVYVPENILADVAYDNDVEKALKTVIYSDDFSFSLRMFLVVEVALAQKNQSRITKESLDEFMSTISNRTKKRPRH